MSEEVTLRERATDTIGTEEEDDEDDEADMADIAVVAEGWERAQIRVCKSNRRCRR